MRMMVAFVAQLCNVVIRKDDTEHWCLPCDRQSSIPSGRVYQKAHFIADESITTTSNATLRDDRILPQTRWLAALIIPFLVVAAALLYGWPNDTDKHFAWAIKPSMTSLMLATA